MINDQRHADKGPKPLELDRTRHWILVTLTDVFVDAALAVAALAIPIASNGLRCQSAAFTAATQR